METQPPFPVMTGQRQLAAIMFTDAVSFSARMHEQEVATMHRMERDSEVMTRIVGAHGGAVLKSTGDGLLISFASAVAAVGCALEIQRGFALRLQPGADPASLRHRIGIHLGDIFVKGGDVMGDGVNVAARIVNEAPPGGIVVSQMVHELVRNKLTLHVAPLGARQLKNIREPVSLYRLLLDPPAPAPRPAPPSESTADTPPAPRRSAAGVVLAAVGLLGAGWYFFAAQRAHERELAESRERKAQLESSLRDIRTAPEPRSPEPAATGFDFAAATTAVPANRRETPEPPERVREAVRLSNTAVVWLEESLRGYTRGRPLEVRSLGAQEFSGAMVYSSPQGELVFVEGGASRARAWNELNDAAKAALLAAALDFAPLSTPEEIRRGAEAFAYLRGRPELVRAIRR